METQKIVNLLDDPDNESSKFVTGQWYVTNDQNNTEYGEGNENDSSIKCETKVKSNQVFVIIQMQMVMQILKLHFKIVLHLQDV